MSKEPPKVEALLPKPIPKIIPTPQGMRKFTVWRGGDESGVSGTGIVIQGVRFADGQCAYQWLAGKSPDVEFRKSFDTLLKLHVLEHPSQLTIITYEDGEQETYGEEKNEFQSTQE